MMIEITLAVVVMEVVVVAQQVAICQAQEMAGIVFLFQVLMMTVIKQIK
jgi:hypothetical protein